MERSYYISDRIVTVEQLENVVALRFRRDIPYEYIDGILNDLLEYKKFPTIEVKRPEVSIQEQIDAFRGARWRFVVQNERESALLRYHYGNTDRRFVPYGSHVIEIGRVYFDNSGHIRVGNDRLVVKWKSEISNESIRLDYHFNIIQKFDFDQNLYQVVVTEQGKDALDKSVDLHNDSNIEFAEPVMHAYMPGRFVPTDPHYKSQWQWKNWGKNNGTLGADIGAESAWDLSKGKGIRIAIIDNGFDVAHPDLAPAVDQKAAAYYEDTGPARLSIYHGLKDFPVDYHGTFCAGIALARANNCTGGCGIACEAEFIPLSCYQERVGPQVAIAQLIADAVDPAKHIRADVISCSIGDNGCSRPLDSILKSAINDATISGRNGLGTPVFWAVSNNIMCNVLEDEVCAYPKVIAVGQSDRNDRGGGGAFGSELSFLAPGTDVLSTKDGGGVAIDTGTSFATPCAAGVAALILSINPKLGCHEVLEIMKKTCDKIGGVNYNLNGRHNTYGYGRINAYRALLLAADYATHQNHP